MMKKKGYSKSGLDYTLDVNPFFDNIYSEE
jgi:hypothetical protein